MKATASQSIVLFLSTSAMLVKRIGVVSVGNRYNLCTTLVFDVIKMF